MSDLIQVRVPRRDMVLYGEAAIWGALWEQAGFGVRKRIHSWWDDITGDRIVLVRREPAS